MADSDIQGIITDETGTTISNAIVAVWLQSNPKNVVTTQTDSNGQYVISNHPDGDGSSQNWRIAVRDPNDSSRQFLSPHSVSAQLSPGIPASVVYDFETGDTSRWDTVNNLSASTSRVYAGDYSGFCGSALENTYQARVMIDEYDAGTQPSKFEFFWNEDSSSYGGGIRLLNSNDNIELGVATNNPQWYIDDNNGFEQVYGGDGYDRWTRFTVTFNWDVGTFDVNFKDLQTGSTYTDSGRPLKNGTDIQIIQIEDNNNETWRHGGSITMWFDNITIET